MAEWYYSSQGQQAGPVELATLQQMIASGQVQPHDLVWRDGMDTWHAAAAVHELNAPPATSQYGTLPAPGSFPQQNVAQQPGYGASPIGYESPGFATRPNGAKGMAIASLSCSASRVPLLCLCYVGIPVAIVGLVLGLVALNNMKKYNNPDGRGLALAGAIVGGCVLAFLGIGVLFAVVAHR